MLRVLNYLSSLIVGAVGGTGRLVREVLRRLSSIIIVTIGGIVIWVGVVAALVFSLALLYPLFLVALVVAIATGSISAFNELIQSATKKVKNS